MPAPESRVIRSWSNSKQQWLVERGAAPTLLVGGINSGKTVGCVLKLLALLQKYPGSRAAIVRRNQNQLKKTTMESFYQWCHPKMYDRGSRNETELNLNNGSRVYFIHLDQPNSLDLLAGLELNFVYVSQVEEISEKAWDLLDVRVGRWTGAVIPEEDFKECEGRDKWPWRNDLGDCVPPRYIFAEGYVTDELHWLYTRFADESPERETWKGLGYESKIVWSEENVYAIRATVEASLAKDEDYVRRYVRPVWGNPEGKIFRILPDSVINPDDPGNETLVERIQRTMKLHRAMDYGETAPTCVGWFGTDWDGNIFVYREYYEPDKLVSEHRQLIYELSKADGFGLAPPRYYSNYADPTLINVSHGRTATAKPSWSPADEYSDTRIMDKETAISWQPSENDEDATRSRLKEYLRLDPNHRNPITRKMGAPRIYFLKKTASYPNGCNRITKEIAAQQRVRAKVGDREVWLDERDKTIVDHAYDMTKYFVVMRPALGPMIPQAPPEPGTIRLVDYEKETSSSRERKRLQERREGVAVYGYGQGGH